MRQFGLIGKDISYSFSESFFLNKFKNESITDSIYSIFDLSSLNHLNALFENENLIGFNVTIPYKEKIIPYLDELSPEAEKIGAVNCVKIQHSKRVGYNTDAFGFRESLKPLLTPNHKKALILGDGGVAKAVKFVLDELNIQYKTVRRDKGYVYSEITQEDVLNHLLIVNCTPLGTFPNVDEKPDIPYHHLTKEHLLFDMIYNPTKTQFLELGELKGATIQNGHEMLVLQAEKSWEIWNQPL